MRDEIRYDMAPDVEGREDWNATATLERGHGFCQQKAVLLAALLRARDIPAGIVLQDLHDHKIPPHYVEFIGSQRLEVHGLTCAFVDGRWVRLDPTLPRALSSGSAIASSSSTARTTPSSPRPTSTASRTSRCSRSSARGLTSRTRSSSTCSGSSGSGGREYTQMARRQGPGM